MKILNTYKMILSFSILLLSSTAWTQDLLNRYLIHAAENNPALKSKFNEYLASIEVGAQVKALPDPELAFGYFIQPIETRTGSQNFKISLSQMLPWFGTLRAKEDLAIMNAKAKYEAFEEAKSKLFNEIRGTYYDLYFNSQAIHIVSENILILKTFKELAEVKVESGEVSPLDQYRIVMEQGELENQLSILKDQYAYLEIAFNNLLNAEFMHVVLPDTLWNYDLGLSKPALQDSIFAQNHQLLELEIQRMSFALRQEVARKTGKPDFSIGLDYFMIGKGQNNLSGRDAFIFPKIGISIPLYKKKYQAMIDEAVYLETAKENEFLEGNNIIMTLFEKSWKELKDAERRYYLYVNQVDLAEKSIELLKTEYLTASVNFEEILRMERKQLTYSLEVERARSDKQAAISFIRYLMGS